MNELDTYKGHELLAAYKRGLNHQIEVLTAISLFNPDVQPVLDDMTRMLDHVEQLKKLANGVADQLAALAQESFP